MFAGKAADQLQGAFGDDDRGSILIIASILTTNIAILVLAGFVGFIVISKIPNTLHTPLMSGTNAIHGIVLVGALILLGTAELGALSEALLVIAVMFGTINIVGGFLVTDRMLDMFKAKKPTAAEGPGGGAVLNAAAGAATARSASEGGRIGDGRGEPDSGGSGGGGGAGGGGAAGGDDVVGGGGDGGKPPGSPVQPSSRQREAGGQPEVRG